MGEGRVRSFRWLFEMDPASFEEPIEEETPPPKPRASRKKVQLVPLEDSGEVPPPPAPKKRARKKLTEEDSEPAQIAFNSTKGDVSFSARKRAKQVEVAEPPSPAPLQRQPRATQAKAPPTPGLYEMLHEHLSARGAEKSQRWSQFLVA